MFEDLKNYTEEMVSFRRSFHKYPETGWTEFRTTAIIAERLNELGYEVLLGKAIINPDFVMGRSKTEGDWCLSGLYWVCRDSGNRPSGPCDSTSL